MKTWKLLLTAALGVAFATNASRDLLLRMDSVHRQPGRE